MLLLGENQKKHKGDLLPTLSELLPPPPNLVSQLRERYKHQTNSCVLCNFVPSQLQPKNVFLFNDLQKLHFAQILLMTHHVALNTITHAQKTSFKYGALSVNMGKHRTVA